MKNLLFLFLSLFLTKSTPTSQNDKASTVKVIVENIDLPKGGVRVCATIHEEKFLNDMEYCQYIPLTKKGQLEVTFDELPFGKYAFVVYHDENGNRKLDLGFMRIPKEPYGFSNKPSTTFGPPSFEKASVDIQTASTAITIQL